MGTSSTIKFYITNEEKPILSVYQKFDGYVGGVGHELAEWLKDKKIINGFYKESMEAGFANGMGCLAAQYIATFKVEIGGLYITTDDDEQDYNYEVRRVDDKFHIKVYNAYDGKIFEGSPEELLSFEETEEE